MSVMPSSSPSKLRVLLVGSGGREHAMAWKLSCSSRLEHLIVVPGNDGMSRDWERWSMPLGTRGDFETLARRALDARVDLAVIGPDNPLADGIVDIFEAAGIPTFGPQASAARIEASKSFAKDVMQAAGVPTARYHLATSAEDARKFLESADWSSGWVLKADGLAYGKGVQVCETLEQARQAVQELKALGSASDQLIIEEKLVGEEISWFAFCDGERCALMEPARDHKRIFDQDQGPNTGGMGAYSPVPGVPASFEKRMRDEVFLPTLKEMKRRGAPFKGVLYAGLMVDRAREKFWVLEFNCRFGDPETQVVLSRMEDDLLEWCWAVARGDLSSHPEKVKFSADSAVIVIAAAKGYPEKPLKGARIEGLPDAPKSDKAAQRFFCAGVARNPQGELTVSGGRVFGAVGLGSTLEQAREQAYNRLRSVKFEGMHFRTDIAGRAAESGASEGVHS